MRCSNCGKKFDYEKYYGICPKCGSLNKNGMTQAEQRSPGEKGSSLFLMFSLAFFCVVLVSSLVYASYYRNNYRYQLEEQLEQEFFDTEVTLEEHKVGEGFSCQGTTLTVMGAKVVDWKEERELPSGKKLVAVKIVGESIGEWEKKNELGFPYIRCGDLYYHAFQGYISQEHEERYEIPMFDEYALCRESHVEGWHLFFVDEQEQEFTLCWAERKYEEIDRIQTIHFIEIQLGEAGNGEKNG